MKQRRRVLAAMLCIMGMAAVALSVAVQKEESTGGSSE